MIWFVISVVELVILTIMAAALVSQEKKYDADLQDMIDRIEVEMTEKNWYLAQKNKFITTIRAIAKEKPDILQMEYMNEFLKEDDEK